MHPDFVAMLSALSGAGAEYLVVGAHALAAHGLPRATGALDIWVRPTVENAGLVWQALAEVDAPLDHLEVSELTEADLVFQIGIPPLRIDILTSITGVRFDEAYRARRTVRVADMDVPILGRAHLIQNKRATARPQDLADVAALENQQDPG